MGAYTEVSSITREWKQDAQKLRADSTAVRSAKVRFTRAQAAARTAESHEAKWERKSHVENEKVIQLSEKVTEADEREAEKEQHAKKVARRMARLEKETMQKEATLVSRARSRWKSASSKQARSKKRAAEADAVMAAARLREK